MFLKTDRGIKNLISNFIGNILQNCVHLMTCNTRTFKKGKSKVVPMFN